MPFLAFGVAALPELHCTLKSFAFRGGLGQCWLRTNSLFIDSWQVCDVEAHVQACFVFPLSCLLPKTATKYINFQLVQRTCWPFADLCPGQKSINGQWSSPLSMVQVCNRSTNNYVRRIKEKNIHHSSNSGSFKIPQRIGEYLKNHLPSENSG